MSIPFEALDILVNRTINLDLSSIYTKVVLDKRGGYCYELNTLFHSLLLEIGFDSTMISSRIYNQDFRGPEFDHMSLIIELEEPLLIDVGFGDLFIEPLKIYSQDIQEGRFKDYKIEQIGDQQFLLLESLKGYNDFKKKYDFTLNARRIEDFLDQNHHKQISPDSHFVKNTICTIATETGRKTVLNNLFKEKINKHITEREIKNHQELLKILKEEFDMELS